ncbi:hypothetical protein G9A89_017018 [Geosiphon pyriformis]|nr:hypothetical protein G9A89_017018 [Geosiphon pyriformis]
MDLVDASAGGSGANLAEVGTCDVVNLSTGPLSLVDIGNVGFKPVVSWKSKVGSISSSVSSLLDVENMENTVAEKTGYAESSRDNNMDKTMLRKTCTQMYVLDNSPKQPLFDHMSNDNTELVLPAPKFVRFNWLLSAKSHVLEKHSFEPVKSFTLDVKLSAMSRKTNKIIIKEIPVDLPKSAIELVFFKFGEVVSVKLQLIRLWQKALMEFKSADVASLVASKWSVFMGKDLVCVVLAHWALLYTFPISTIAHNLSSLLESYGEKTCFIGHNPSSYVYDKCVVVCFENKTSRLAAFDSVLVFKDVNLHWAGFFLAGCAKYKQFGHISDVCSMGGNSGVHIKWLVTNWDQVHLAGIYKKKQALIVYLVLFGKKTWAQIAGSFSSSVVFLVVFGAKPSPSANSTPLTPNSLVVSGLNNCLAFLEHFLGFLANQVSGILRKLSFVNLMLLASFFIAFLFVVSASSAMDASSDMILDSVLVLSVSLFLAVGNVVLSFSSNSSKVLTNKVGGLESKLASLETLIGLVLARLDHLCFGLGFPLPPLSQ